MPFHGFPKVSPRHLFLSVKKMRKKCIISTAVVSLLLIAIITTSALATNLNLSQNITNLEEQKETEKSINIESLSTSAKERYLVKINDDETTSINPNDIKEPLENEPANIQEKVPQTYEEAEALVSIQRVRFLLYTNDGKHIMWGFVGNNYFVGQDNMDKRCWGIYGKGIFAGFYDQQFFWGKYRGGNWKAEGLFETNFTYGKYILFPTINTDSTLTAVNP
ncbi:MAG: hypothetical protein P8Y18_02125 [Candidatus Bathyarchaeota archaeon]